MHNDTPRSVQLYRVLCSGKEAHSEYIARKSRFSPAAQLNLARACVINPQAQATQPKDVRCTVYMNVKTAIERTFLITRFIQLLHAPMFSPFLQRYINIYICNSSEQRWWGTVFWKTIISEKVQGNDFDSRKHTHTHTHTHDARTRARAHTHTHTHTTHARARTHTHTHTEAIALFADPA